MNLFDQYGIKEVADVTIYKIADDGTETPFLFLDSLKVSTLEQTAEQAEARGGKGNSPLIIWDYGKEITVTLEDALYSPASMALMFGGKDAVWTSVDTMTKTLRYVATGSTVPTKLDDGGLASDAGKWTVEKLTNAKGEPATTVTKGETYIATVSATIIGNKLTIDADDFPGTYKLVGDTYARNRDSGKDEYFQFVIPRAKMNAEETLTLEAEGDPTTFNLTMRVLRPKTGHMIELIQYNLGGEEQGDEN